MGRDLMGRKVEKQKFQGGGKGAESKMRQRRGEVKGYRLETGRWN